MGWHLCSDSNSDSLEVLPLCKGIRWLGYGFPVGDEKDNWKVMSMSNGKDTVRQTGIYTGHTPPAWLKSWPIILTALMWHATHGDTSLIQHIFCARFCGTIIYNMTCTALLCSNCHLSHDCIVLLCALIFATHLVFIPYKVSPKLIST